MIPFNLRSTMCSYPAHAHYACHPFDYNSVTLIIFVTSTNYECLHCAVIFIILLIPPPCVQKLC
jgi:hypothetical protein